MQTYRQPQGYQRPGSTTSFTGPAGPPPPYGAPQGYQSAAPQAQSQWAPPAQNSTTSQQWNQPQQQAGAYNPGVYGAMPGAYSQGQPSNAYPSQQQDVPPPPPPKPAGFAATVQQQNTQSWGQQPACGAQQPQQSTEFAPQGQQGGYNQQGGFQNQGTTQQPYNNAAPPPPSQTPGGSHFPPPQSPQSGGRPGSIYGADQVGTYSSPAAAVPQQPPSSVLSPNEQQPAYIPPSLTGQGVQSYMPANTNPMPGVYVPPPPDIPAWQQAQHAPLQGGQKFKYTKPTVDPSFYAQGYQGVQPMQQQGQQYGQQPVQPQQNQQQFGQPAQNQFQPQGQMQQQGQFGQAVQNQLPQGQPQQSQFGQPAQPQNQFPQQTPQYNESPQQFQQQPSQWQQPPADQGFGQQQHNTQTPYAAQQPAQQQAWQPGDQAQGSITGQQYPQGQGPGIQAPKPISGHTGTTPPGFVNQPSPQSLPVSPVQQRQSVSVGSGQTNLGRTGSVSSIALGAIHSQRAGNRTESPKPAPPKLPTPPPRDPVSKFSALGMGGPSDWEHFGMGADEVDDEELFGAKKEENKDKPEQLDSVELPAQHPSPPPTQGEWPSPPNQPAPLNLQRRDTYQPTPPPKSSGTPAQRLPSQQPQHSFNMGDAPPPQQQTQAGFVMGDAAPPAQQPHQSFVMGDAAVAPSNTTQSPQPAQHSQPPSAQQGFVMGDGGWAPPKQGTPTQQQPQQQPPPSTQQGFVMEDGGWATQSAPSQQVICQTQQPARTNSTFVMGDAGWGASQQTPTQTTSGWGAQPSQAHLAELKAKDEAYERLRTDANKERADLRVEIDQLKTVIAATMSQAESERRVLAEQIESMKATAEQAKSNTDALAKEKESMIERLKEDAEGKDDAIKEKDATIADLRRRLMDKDTAMADLEQQIEAEKSKEAPKPAPADLVPDIDPWYAGSLERYITMLRGEAHEPLVEDKIKVFTDFLRAESGIRSIPYHDAPPQAPFAQEPVQHVEPSSTLSRGPSNASIRTQDLNVQVPEQHQSTQDEFQYSPGGRPILVRQSTLKSDENVPAQRSFSISGETSGQSTTVYTPTSSQDEDFNKTSTPMQSPPEEQLQPLYKAYVPPGISQEQSTKLLHRQSMSFNSPVPPSRGVSPSKNNDEIFFEPQPATKPSSRPTTSASVVSNAAVPAPHSTPQPGAAAAPTPAPAAKQDPLEILADLIPAQVAPALPNPQLEEIRKNMSEFKPDLAFVQDLTTTWEKSAALARKKNDDARRKRQEESEAHTDELFNDHQISYADIGGIEDEFKEKERELKAQEDRDEYKSYVENVFDKVYDGLQSQIKSLMDLYIEAESQVHTSVSGIKSLEGNNAATIQSSLELLIQLHGQIEARHEKVVRAVSERDKRYKKTEIQPLYAAGNIAKMKNVEKHFENAERQAVLRAKSEKAERVGELVRVAEEVVVGAVGIEQGEIDRILAAIRALPTNSDIDLLSRAHATLLALKSSSKSLLSLFNAMEIDLNTSVLEAEIAQARVEGSGLENVKELEAEMKEGEKKLREEFERRVGVLEQDRAGIDGLVEEKGGKVKLTEEEEKKARMMAALEEAKRRNGDLC